MIDLHCHSYHSDGLLSPEELVLKAVSGRVKQLALTDHDTLAGFQALQKAAFETEISIVPGIELSIQWRRRDIHILGLNVSPADEALGALIAQQSEKRTLRAKEMARRLEPLGITDAYTKVCDIAGHERIARPHFAKLLIDEGKVPDAKTAFQKYLRRGRPAYVPTQWTSLEEAIQVIRGAGGHAVIAHPLKYKLTRLKLHELIYAFKLAGGTGIEVVSGAMLALEIGDLVKLCHQYDLLGSTGSDYHGDGISRIGLGQQQSFPVHCQPIWTLF